MAKGEGEREREAAWLGVWEFYLVFSCLCANKPVCMYPELCTVCVLATECTTVAVTGSRTVRDTEQTPHQHTNNTMRHK